MKHPFALTVLTLSLIGAGCGAATTTPTPTTPTPAPQAQAPTPPPPTRTPETRVTLTGAINYSTNILTVCGSAQPARNGNPERGFQFRGTSMGRDNNGTGAYLTVNFFRGTVRAAGEQPVHERDGGLATIQYTADPNDPSRTFSPVEGQSSVSIAEDFQSATFTGVFANAVDSNQRIEVDAQIKCQ